MVSLQLISLTSQTQNIEFILFHNFDMLHNLAQVTHCKVFKTLLIMFRTVAEDFIQYYQNITVKTTFSKTVY